MLRKYIFMLETYHKNMIQRATLNSYEQHKIT